MKPMTPMMKHNIGVGASVQEKIFYDIVSKQLNELMKKTLIDYGTNTQTFLPKTL